MKNTHRTCVLMIVLGTSLALSSASGQTGKQGPMKYDEFGYLNHENYSAHLDNIAIALQGDQTAQGYFLFYNGRRSLPGAALRYMKRLQNYLVNTRGIEPSRMLLFEGGRREEMAIEFWISPPGSPAPVPTPTASVELTGKKTYLYDRYSFDCDRLFQPKVKAPYYDDDCGYAGSGYEDQSARLDGFITAIILPPGMAAHLVVYSLPRDARRKVQKFIQQEKDYLLRIGGLDASVVSRTTRKNRSVELWVVPPRGPAQSRPMKQMDVHRRRL